MYGDLSSEVVHCPNCNEDVPKTLYCLNCGYPLYKIEQEEKAEVQPEAEPEALEVVVPEAPEVDMSVEIEQPEETFVLEEPEPETVAEPELELEPETEPELEPEPVPELETEIETTIRVEEVAAEEVPLEESEPEIHVEVVEEEPVEAEPMVDVETKTEVPLEEEPEIEPEAVEEPHVEEPVVEEPEIEEEIPMPEVEEKIIMEPEQPEKAIDFIKEEPELMEAIRLEFAPDPLTKEVMENLAKNITLKIRLVRLLRDSQVKEETFKKLFDSYVEQGRIWVSRRDDTVRRFKTDIDRMEEALVTARKDFELLEIRRNIGDADDEEYKVKAPAYKWDIEHLEEEIKNRKGGILYVANLKKLVPEDEIIELKKMADTDYNVLDKIEEIKAETIAKMKETLAESLNTLNS